MRVNQGNTVKPQRAHPIKAARQKAKLSQSELGKLVGVQKAAVSKWERGDGRPDPDTAMALTKALPGLTMDRIYASQPARGRAVAA